jgi:hypothetical protein
MLTALALATFLGMALTLEDINLVKRRTRWDTRKPGVSENLRALFKHMESKSNPDLKFQAISGLETADVVLSDSACKLYALYLVKPTASTVNAWMHLSDHATVSSSGDVTVKFVGTGGGGQVHCVTFPDGLQLATGATVGCHTAVGGTSKSLVADAVTGFGIVGAP